MSVFTLSLNHHGAPLDLRGRFAFMPEQLPRALRLVITLVEGGVVERIFDLPAAE
jgi:hypothetical protein